MQLNTHLNFDGQCRAAFEFYAKCLGGKVTLMMTYGDSPMAAHVPAGDHGKIVHASLGIGDQRLTGADLPQGRYEKPQGFEVLLSPEDPEEAERVFVALADGGAVQMPLQETFWSLRFGMLTDRFGTPWMVNCNKPV
jgi:PhnB protein